MTEPKKPATDWERIEVEYRAGQLSVSEIARRNGVTEGAVRKRAKRDGWERDITAKVDARVRNALVRAEVRAANSDQRARTERETIEIVAATRVEVVRGHRTRARKALTLVDTLAEQLEVAIGSREVFQAAIEEMTKDDKTDQRYNALMRAVSLPVHIGALKDLGQALRGLVNVERQAFGMAETDDPAPPEPPKEGDPADTALQAARERQIKRLTNAAEPPA